MCVRERGRERQSICLIKNYARVSNQALTCEAKTDVSTHKKLFVKCLRFCFSSNAKMKINSHILRFWGDKQNPPEGLFLAWIALVISQALRSSPPQGWWRQPTVTRMSASFNVTFCPVLSNANSERMRRKGKSAWQSLPSLTLVRIQNSSPCPRKHSSGFTLE